MFDSLIDNLCSGSWKEISMAEKNEAEWKEYHVLKQHKHVDACTMSYCVAIEDGDPKSVEVKNCQEQKDPLANIGQIELKLNANEDEIVGIDLNGDIVVRI